MPLDEHLLLPGLELEVVVVLHGKLGTDVIIVGAPALVLVAHGVDIAVGITSVARRHIEVGTGKVALVLVLGFENPEIDIQHVVMYFAHLERAGIAFEVLHRNAQGIVAARAVSLAVGGVEVIAVLVGVVVVATPPALGKAMLDVAACSHLTG